LRFEGEAAVDRQRMDVAAGYNLADEVRLVFGRIEASRHKMVTAPTPDLRSPSALQSFGVFGIWKTLFSSWTFPVAWSRRRISNRSRI